MITRPRHRKTIFFSIGLVCLILLAFISGCTKTIHTEPTGEMGPTPIVTIREFPDVPIPKELDLNEKESFVVYAVSLYIMAMLTTIRSSDFSTRPW
jgi:hypothetical protein